MDQEARQAIITVASPKGGVGKTTLAYELAALFGAVLVDLDWDLGGATGMVGDDPERRVRSALLDGLATGQGPTPRPLHIPGRPAVVPSDSRLTELRVTPELVVDRLRTWSTEWARPVVVDTHPGTGNLADGAMAASDVIAVPIILGQRELEALHGFLRRVWKANWPLVIVPTRWRALKADEHLLNALVEFSRQTGVLVSPPIPEFPWLHRRQHRGALTLVADPGMDVREAAIAYQDVARMLLHRMQGGRR